MTPARKRFPLLLAIALFAAWLLLNQTLALGQIVLGAALAVLLARASLALRPLLPAVKRLHVAVPLFWAAFTDVVMSNAAVALIVLGLVRNRTIRSGFVDIPLELRDPHGLAVLAMIVTATPGTVWAGLSPDGSTLTLHMLDIRDEQDWIRWFKDRYERRIMRIFE